VFKPDNSLRVALARILAWKYVLSVRFRWTLIIYH
jgi:hypothetical protein